MGRAPRAGTGTRRSPVRARCPPPPAAAWRPVWPPAVRLVACPSGMANIKSQIKRNKTNEKRRLRNKAARSEIKTRVKVALTAAAETPEEAADALRVAIKRLDKAAAKGIIHKNQAANRKSRLMRRIARQTSASA